MQTTNHIEIHGVHLLCDSDYVDKIQSLINNILVLGSMHDEFKVCSSVEKKTHSTFFNINIERKNATHLYFNFSIFTNTHIMKKKSIAKVKEKKMDGITFNFSESFKKIAKMNLSEYCLNYNNGYISFTTSDWESVIKILTNVQKFFLEH
jgi:hypothetical protein